MVLTWQKPKYAPFEEQAEHEQGSGAAAVLDAEDDVVQAQVVDDESSLPSTGNSFQVDLLDNWFKP